MIGGIALLLGLLSWLMWPNGENKGNLKYVDGIAVDQPSKDAKPRTVLWEKPRLLLGENEESVNQYDPTLSADELTLIFVRGRAHPDVGADLYQVRRISVTESWGVPELLSGEINTAHDEIGPELSPDGRWLFFASDRPGGRGGYDIWFSSRDGNGWSAPRTVPGINTEHDEIDPAWFVRPNDVVDDKVEPRTFESGLYFASNRPKAIAAQPKAPHWKGTLRRQEPSKPDDYDIFLAQANLESSEKESGAAGPEKESHEEKTEDEAGKDSSLVVIPPALTQAPVLRAARRLDHVNTSAREGQPALTPRGDFLYFSSNRQEAQGNRKGRTDFDLYRARIYPPEFRAPENVGSPVNTVGDETDPFLFSGGHSLLFSSNPDGGDAVYNLLETHTREPVLVAIKENPTQETDAGSGFTDWFEKYQWWILLLILALLALLWLLKKFLDEEQRRHLSLMHRCVLSSLMLHLLLAFLLSLWVISEAVYKIIKEQTPEIAVQEKQLAQERMALNLREQTTQLPQIHTPLPAEQKKEQQPNIETHHLQPSIEIEIQQATSQSFAAKPQRVQPPSKKLDELEFIKPQIDLEVTLKSQTVPLEESVPQGVTGQRLAPASSQVEVVKAQAKTREVALQTAALTLVEDQPKQQVALEAKTSSAEVKMALTPLQLTTVQSDIQQPMPQSQTVPLEEADPQGVAGQRLAPASSQVEVVKAQAKTREVAPQATALTLVEDQPKQQATVEANPSPAEVRTALTPLQLTTVQSDIQQSVPQSQTVLLEEADLQGVDAAPLAPASSQVEVVKAKAKPQEVALQATVLMFSEDQPEQQAALEAKTSSAEVKTGLAPLQLTKVQSDIQQPISQAQTVPLEEADPQGVDGPQLAPASSEVKAVKAQARAQEVALHATALTLSEDQPSRQLALEAKVSPVEVKTGLKGLPDAVGMIELSDIKLNVDIPIEPESKYDKPMVLRDPKERKKFIVKLGGTDKTEEAIERALDWFTKHQEKDGSWSMKRHGGQKNHDVAATSFAVLCYFGWGIKHNQSGKSYKHQKTVQNALKWLVDNMGKDGDFTNGQGNGMYDQGVAAMALAEAYGLTKDPDLKEPLQKAVDFIIKAQNPNHGAWDYKP
ncbi:MAG: hypothetical protein QF685_02995, partial [Verrucomicrobiota bacterium]|nr:hypothetical protein [Verrucomicrobiota bacterium]